MKENKIPNSIKIILLISIIVFIFLMYLRFVSTNGLKVKEYKIVNSNITENYHGLKIVHFSDVHYKSTINYKDLEEIVNRINYIKPDIVVFTGDLFDIHIDYSEKDIKDLTNLLSKIEVSYKKYAIDGNHDKEEMWKSVINNSGFVDLKDNYELIYINNQKPILLAGISSGTTDVEAKLLNVNKYLYSDNANQIYSILLMHEPDNIKYTSDFDLALAGHSHNGQVRLPYIGAVFTPNGSKKYYDEYYKVNKTDLYISSGLGSSILNLRFFNKPSINLYRITNK